MLHLDGRCKSFLVPGRSLAWTIAPITAAGVVGRSCSRNAAEKNLLAFGFVVLDELAERILLRLAEPFALRQGTGPVQNAPRIQKRRQDCLVEAVSGITVHLDHGMTEVLFHKFFQQNC